MPHGMSAVIIESQELFGAGLKQLVARDRCKLRAHLYTSFDAALEDLKPFSNIRLALLDIEAPGVNGLASTTLLRKRFPGVRIILTTTRARRAEILECLSWAVHGVVEKTQSSSDIAAAIRLVMTGGVFVPPAAYDTPTYRAVSSAVALGERYGSPIEGEADVSSQPQRYREFPRLSSRQVAVLELISLGMSNKAIARELDLAEGTIKVHVAALYRALDVHNRASAISRMSREGIGRVWQSCLAILFMLYGFPSL